MRSFVCSKGCVCVLKGVCVVKDACVKKECMRERVCSKECVCGKGAGQEFVPVAGAVVPDADLADRCSLLRATCARLGDRTPHELLTPGKGDMTHSYM